MVGVRNAPFPARSAVPFCFAMGTFSFKGSRYIHGLGVAVPHRSRILIQLYHDCRDLARKGEARDRLFGTFRLNLDGRFDFVA